MFKKITWIAFCLFCFLIACKKQETVKTTPFEFNLPSGYPKPRIPADNPMTVEGIELGRHLFYETKLSADNSISCGSCHMQEHGFSDPRKFSIGINGDVGRRQSMPLINLAFNYNQRFFWDARSKDLEDQVLHPIQDPKEMANNWSTVVQRLKEDSRYPALFKSAFGTEEIDSSLASKALAQFVRSIVSFDSRYDRWIQGRGSLSQSEQNGLALMQDMAKGDCFHCHNAEDRLFTSTVMSNNGLDAQSNWTDLGYYEYTGNPEDKAKFKVPTLRNIYLTGPYMHDGRFQSVDDVLLLHYLGGGLLSPTIDVNMQFAGTTGLNLSPNEVVDILNFLKTLTDSTMINNSAYRSPF